MNVNARCDEPADQSNARGAQHAPERAGRPPTPARRSWRRTTRPPASSPGATRPRRRGGFPRPVALAPPSLGEESWKWLFLQPLTSRSGVTEETDPVQDPGERTTSHSLRLTLLVVLSVLLLAVRGGGRSTSRPPGRCSALGIDGDQDALQSERESVMAQAEQFMLRINTYGPDLLEGDTMPKYRELVEEVITPKFAADFEKNAPLAEATVKQAGLGAHRRGVQHRRLGHRRRLRHRAGGRLDHPVLPEEPGLRRAGGDRPGAVPRPGHAWSRSRAPGWSTTSRRSPAAEDATAAATPPAPARPVPTEGATPVTPTWYDLLGVEPGRRRPTRSAAAWKAAIADLDPGDRRFRTLNEAAEVLLDPDRRAAYDATLAPPRPSDPSRAGRRRARQSRTPSSTSPAAGPPATRRRPGLAARGRRARRGVLLVAAAGYLAPSPPTRRSRTAPARPRARPSRRSPRSWPTTTATSTRTRRPPAS